MIVVTGAAGFIGSCMTAWLQAAGRASIVAVDDFSREDKKPNYQDKEGLLKIDRRQVFAFISANANEVEAIIHLGARTDTVDPDPEIFLDLNINYSKELWTLCANYEIPFIYASSAATYGNGEHGFDDAAPVKDLGKLEPLNEYGRSKHIFDQWMYAQEDKPPYWVGLKFFNVYGPNEYHKGRMASVIFHAFHQISKTGKMKLFRSHKAAFEDGMQLRDFIYVKDVCKTILKIIETPISSGIYNLGTGTARTFLDLVSSTFHAMRMEPHIEYIDIPEDIRDNYQYYTEAEMTKLENQVGTLNFTSLEKGVSDYVRNYLIPTSYL